jgi:hypothetical protein
LFDLVDLAENAFAPFIDQRTDLGDVEAARRAMQQLRPEPILERTDMLAHHRL